MVGHAFHIARPAPTPRTSANPPDVPRTMAGWRFSKAGSCPTDDVEPSIISAIRTLNPGIVTADRHTLVAV